MAYSAMSVKVNLMQIPLLAKDEASRQKALEELEVLDTPAEQEFDDIAALASFICQTPIALISLIDRERQWFKSHHGLEVQEMSRDISFCGHAILGDDLFEVPDALADERFADNPIVTGGPQVRFYAGVPLRTQDDHKIGTICVVDSKPRQLTDDQRAALKALARQVMRLFELRAWKARETELQKALFLEADLNRSMIEAAGEAIIAADLQGTVVVFNPAAEKLLGYTAGEVVGKVTAELFHDPEDVRLAGEALSKERGRSIAGFEALALPVLEQGTVSWEWRYVRQDGERIPVSITVSTRRNEKGELIGFLALASDLRERRALSSETSMNRAIVDHAGTAIIATDLDGTITTFNPAAEQLLGYTAAEVVGVGRPDRFHDPDELAVRARELTTSAGEAVEGFEVFVRPLREAAADTRRWTYVRKDGARVPVTLTVSTLRDEKGRAVGYVGTARDLSLAQKQEEQERNISKIGEIVRASQEDFITGLPRDELFNRVLARLLDFTGTEYGFIGEVLRDEKGDPYLKTYALTNISWNEATRKLYEESKATGFVFRNLHTLFGAAMTTQKPVLANNPAHDPRRGGLPEGHPAMHNFLGLPLMYGDDMVGLVGVANRADGFDEALVKLLQPLALSAASLIQAQRLEAERREAQGSLAEQEHRLRLIIETAADCFVEVSPEGRVTEWNLNAEKQLRVPRSEALGRPVAELVTFRETDGTGRLLSDYAGPSSTEPGRPCDVTVVRQDGSEFAAELVVWKVETGRGSSLCAFVRSVSQRQELARQQMLRFQSETLLKEVHHRIKNNMQVISSLLSIQSSKLKDEEQREVFLECRERIRAMSLIHDRLYSTGDYARIDFGDYLREMVSLITASNRPGAAEIKIDLQAEPVVLPVERAVPLSLIAAELVLNSLKHGFTGRERGTLTVRLAKEGTTCTLFIGDDGPGLPAEPVPRGGVGLQLIEGLTRQIRAQREVRTDGPGAGTSIIWQE